MENKKHIINMIDNNVNGIHQLSQNKVYIWSNYIVFSSLWWMEVALSIVPWVFGYIYRRKQSTDRLESVNSFV